MAAVIVQEIVAAGMPFQSYGIDEAMHFIGREQGFAHDDRLPKGVRCVPARWDTENAAAMWAGGAAEAPLGTMHFHAGVERASTHQEEHVVDIGNHVRVREIIDIQSDQAAWRGRPEQGRPDWRAHHAWMAWWMA